MKYKKATEAYILYSGICDNKLFLQITDYWKELKYSFESPELDMTNIDSICGGIMDACADFFDPSHFKFDEKFLLSRNHHHTERRYGVKLEPRSKMELPAKSFVDLKLPYGLSVLIMESYLPFEKVEMDNNEKSNVNRLIASSPQILTVDSFTTSGIAE